MINSEYLKTLEKYELLCEEILKISKETYRKEEIGSHIFGKLASHAITLQKLIL